MTAASPTALNSKPMPTFENIDGEKLFMIFDQLISQKILVKVYLPQIDYENLTLITDTRTDGQRPIFMIDVPKGLHEALAGLESNRLAFEFTSTDKVTHRFHCDIDAVCGNTISMLYPSFIQRHQQRDNFRVKAPADSHAVLTIENTRMQMEIDNVSLGGVYCYCPNKYKPMMAEDRVLAEMELIFSFKNQWINISIQQAKILRTESRQRPRHFGIAFEFIQIKRDARRMLVQHIYEIQRAFLQNRLKTMP